MSKVKINKTDFKKLSKWSESVYNIAVVVDYFCSTQQEIEELYNLIPVIKSLRKQADELNVFFINFKLNN